MLCLITDGDKINRNLWAVEYISEGDDEKIRREYQLNQWTYHRINVSSINRKVAKRVIKKFRKENTPVLIRSKPFYQIPSSIFIQMLNDITSQQLTSSICQLV